MSLVVVRCCYGVLPNFITNALPFILQPALPTQSLVGYFFESKLTPGTCYKMWGEAGYEEKRYLNRFG